jgi:hypothetical protein
VFRFRGAEPNHEALGEMFEGLPALDHNEPPADECCRYLDASSERLLLGPVSLERFARLMPPSVAAFRLGGRGRIARFETPAGPMSRMVFTYPSAAVAQERSAAFGALEGAHVRLVDRRVAVILSPVDAVEADQLLHDMYEGEAVVWDTREWDSGMTLDGGIGMVLTGFALGGLIAVLRQLGKRREGIPDRTIALHLG